MKQKLCLMTACLLLMLLSTFGMAAAALDLAAPLDLADGEYTVEVELAGGTGRASITSPTRLVVKNGEAFARIEWSSHNYDYMKLDGEQYLPLAGEENSVFELPVMAFDTPITVVADTTAMSTPHEIEYTLVFVGESVASGQQMIYLYGVLCLVLLVLVLFYVRRKKTK